MCLMYGNDVAHALLDELGAKDASTIRRRLTEMANDADTSRSGYLDAPQHSMTGMPQDLKHVKKMRIGRHRVYWEGHHSGCQYRLCYIKMFKKAGTDDENDRAFHRKLTNAFTTTGSKLLITQSSPPEETKSAGE